MLLDFSRGNKYGNIVINNEVYESSYHYNPKKCPIATIYVTEEPITRCKGRLKFPKDAKKTALSVCKYGRPNFIRGEHNFSFTITQFECSNEVIFNALMNHVIHVYTSSNCTELRILEQARLLTYLDTWLGDNSMHYNLDTLIFPGDIYKPEIFDTAVTA